MDVQTYGQQIVHLLHSISRHQLPCRIKLVATAQEEAASTEAAHVRAAVSQRAWSSQLGHLGHADKLVDAWTAAAITPEGLTAHPMYNYFEILGAGVGQTKSIALTAIVVEH
jgi:hypothetical protein